ncbi:MAG: OmpP1/FadL family transporter [Thermoanaerobaculia bacterium]
MFKSTRNRLTVFVLVGLVAVVSAGRLDAAGFALFEQSSKGNAVAGAFAATADDPSAMFYNPAGNAFIDRTTLEGGGFAILRPTARLDGQSPYPGDGYSASMNKELYAIGHGYGVLPLSNSVKLSVGFWVPNGLGVPWENPDTFAGRYISQRVDLRQLSVSAQLAVKLSDMIAVGAGPEFRFTDVRLSKNIEAVNPFTQRVVDIAHVSVVSEGTPVDVGFAAGLLFKPCERVRFGISYHSHVDVDLEGPANFYQIPTGSPQFDAAVAQGLPFGKGARARTTIQFPGVTMFGVAYEAMPNLTLEADGTYTTWSVFDQTVLQIDGVPDTKLVHGWQNAWAFRAGLTYRMGSSWIAGGFLYDQTPQPDADVGPFLPDANRTGGTIGAGIAITKHFQFQFSGLFLWFHQRTITTSKDNFSATYQTFAILPSATLKLTF